MTIIDDVRKDRVLLSEAMKKHKGIRKVVEDMYPDSAHFIYELLQNAEDTGATEAKFTLSKENLIFEHNGRPFEEADIAAITDIGEGTKENDEEKIGRFGIGFKAIFAYTETPYISSPTFSFKIEDFVLPYTIASESGIGKSTVFRFPFNNPKKLKKDAFNEIQSKLLDFTEITLLYLSNLSIIRWEILAGKSGELLRIQRSGNLIEMVKKVDEEKEKISHFLKFEAPVIGVESQRVAIAFRLDLQKDITSLKLKKPLSKLFEISSALPGTVSVYFPAIKEVSGLRFHLHAPFLSEASRASVKETNANVPLYQQLAKLVVVSLHEIRDLGLLTTQFLATLPNTQDTILPNYECIRKAVIDEMNASPLTPTYTKGHKPARVMLKASAELKDLLTEEDLNTVILNNVNHQFPMESELFWAAAARQKNSDADKFLSSLAIQNFDIEMVDDFFSEFFDYSTREEAFLWIGKKSIMWHQQLYAFLNVNEEAFYWTRRSSPIFRLQNGKYKTASDCYFSENRIAGSKNFDMVDKEIYTIGRNKKRQENAKQFLIGSGIEEISKRVIIERLLEENYSDDSFNPGKDLKSFVQLFEEDPSAAEIFKGFYIFETPEEGRWMTSNEAYIDEPLEKTGVHFIYKNSPDLYPLSGRYPDGVGGKNGKKKLAKFAKAIGARTSLVVDRDNCVNNANFPSLLNGLYGKSSTPRNEDYIIKGLDAALRNPSVEVSKFVWNAMLSFNRVYLKAIYGYNKTEGYRKSASQLVHILTNANWVPQGNGVFLNPASASSQSLPEGFLFDKGNVWIQAIQFGDEKRKKSELYQANKNIAIQAGFDSSEELESFIKAKKAGFNPSVYIEETKRLSILSKPQENVKNPGRRERKVLEIASDTLHKESIKRERTIQKGIKKAAAEAKAYLRPKYTNDDLQLMCQCCHMEMPFKLPGGSYYFEAVNCVKTKEKEFFQNHLALCPTCAAMYKYALESTELEILEKIGEVPNESELLSVEIPIQLAGRGYSLYFVGTHLFDLKTILAAPG